MCIKNICNHYGIQNYFKGGRIKEYLGELCRAFAERYNEHLKAPSPIYEHQSSTGHSTTLDIFSIVGLEGHNLSKSSKEFIYIRFNNPTLNRNIGMYKLPHGTEFCLPP